MKELPKGWTLTKLGEICSPPQYGYTTKAVDTGNIKLLRTTDITSGKINWDTVPYCLNDPEEPEKYVLKNEDIVISRAGSVGVSYLIKDPEYSVFASYLIRFNPLINKKFFKFFLDSPFYWDNISEKKLGIAIPNVNANKLKDIDFPIAPLPEQHRIVAKIEELFSDLDKGIEQLKTTQQQLKVYRQAVLKWAFEGKLTEKWRKTHQVEPAEKLLEQIKEERERHYQQQLKYWQESVKEWEAKGKEGKKPSMPNKPKILPPLSEDELLNLPQLPEKWRWEKLGNIVFDVCLGKMLDKRKNRGEYLPYLRNINVRWCSFDLSELLKMRFEPDENERYGIEKGDLIICEGGEPGRAAIWNDQLPNMKIQKALHRVRFFDKLVNNFFILYYLLYSSKGGFLSKYYTGTTIKHLTGVGLANITIPLTSIFEQHQIVQEIETRLSVCDNIEANIEESLQKAEALRQSILKKAFEGKLVSQDPNDEPAYMLLERIKAEKAKYDKQKNNSPIKEKEKAL